MLKNSHKVKVMPKFGGRTGILPGENLDNAYQGIGSSFRGQSIARGLFPDEEDKYLPDIIGVRPTDQGYAKAKRDYWINIARKVPATGLELEVGFRYKSNEDATKGQKEADDEAAKIEAARKTGARYDEVFDVRGSLGDPMNLQDYILYRYLLIYSDCANHPEDQYKSSRIRMYIVDEKAEQAKKVIILKNQKKAMAVLLGLDEKPSNKRAILRLMSDKLYAAKMNFKTPAEIEIALDYLSRTYPMEFVGIASDERLMKKALVHRAIEFQFLRRVPNTNIIMYGDDLRVGQSLDEAADWLFASENLQILQSIKGQLKTAN